MQLNEVICKKLYIWKPVVLFAAYCELAFVFQSKRSVELSQLAVRRNTFEIQCLSNTAIFFR